MHSVGVISFSGSGAKEMVEGFFSWSPLYEHTDIKIDLGVVEWLESSVLVFYQNETLEVTIESFSDELVGGSGNPLTGNQGLTLLRFVAMYGSGLQISDKDLESLKKPGDEVERNLELGLVADYGNQEWVLLVEHEYEMEADGTISREIHVHLEDPIKDRENLSVVIYKVK